MRAWTFPEGAAVACEIPEALVEESRASRKEMVEKLSEFSDELATMYLEEREVPASIIKEVARQCVIGSMLTPVFCGAAYRNMGIQPLLDAVVDYLPSPLDRGLATGTSTSDPSRVEARSPSAGEPFSCLAFKIIHDPYVGQQTFVRTYSGVLRPGSQVLNTSTGRKERVSRVLRIHAKSRIDLGEVGPGDIVALIGPKNTLTGHTLCDPSAPILLESVQVPIPVISVKVAAGGRKEEEKLHDSLRRLSLEDPSFLVKRTDRIHETVISGMGELHLEIIVDRLMTEFGVEVSVGAVSVEKKETVSQTAVHEYRHVKQTGGHGQYAHTVLRVEPNPGKGFEFENRVVGGRVPVEYVPAVRKGVEDVLERGILADYRVVDLRVVLLDGSAHDVDSSDLAFRSCASTCLKEAFMRASPRLLEPIMSLELATPDEFIGDLIGDLSQRRGKVHHMRRYRKGSQKISAEAPLMEMFGYATAVRSLSSGRANHSMELARYSALPEKLMEKVLEEARARMRGEA